MPEPIPAMLLARLAVDRSAQGEGLGRQLLRDAMLRSLDAAEIAGIRILLVHAIDERAKEWSRQFDFEESPTDPLQLMLLLDDLRRELE
jgi:GNAT superfamily N-acetyltransferase